MRAERTDFVNIRLTAAGVNQVGSGGALTFSNRHMHYTFKPGEEQEVVLRYEWNAVLRHERAAGTSDPLFEVVEDIQADNSADPDEQIKEEGENNGSI
jgi:hypothetical protein